MGQFIITAPNGKKYKVTGPDQAGALAALKKHLGAAKKPAAQTAQTPVGMPSVPIQSGRQASPIVPNQPMPENPELMMIGPGPTGGGMKELYDQGILPRRYVDGLAKADATQFSPRTGTDLPMTVQDAQGATYYLNPETGSYSSREMMADAARQRFQSGEYGMGTAMQAGAASGFTMGAGDEVAGAVMGDKTRENARAVLDAARSERPYSTGAGEIAGALALPVPGPAKGAALKEAITYGAKVGGGLGATYAAASAEGGAIDRIEEGLKGAVSGAIFGAAAPVVINLGSKAFRRLSAAKPTLESLRTAKSAAYSAVDSAGEKFAPAELKTMVERARQGLDDFNYVPEADNNTTGILRLLDSVSERELTLGQLDKMRQRVWSRYNASKEVGLLEVIDSIDELVMSRSSTSELLDAARLANGRYKKAELLELAFQKANDQTAATGSGGNILNKYRQAVTSIINDPKRAKWFSAEEIQTMRTFVHGSPGSNVMRLIGKLAPSGNGLMTALNLGAAAYNPSMLAISAGVSAAKGISDAAVERGAQRLIGMASGAKPTPNTAPVNYPGRLNALGAVLTNN